MTNILSHIGIHSGNRLRMSGKVEFFTFLLYGNNILSLSLHKIGLYLHKIEFGSANIKRTYARLCAIIIIDKLNNQ